MKDYEFPSMVGDLFFLKRVYKTLEILQVWEDAIVKPVKEIFKDDESKSAILKLILD